MVCSPTRAAWVSRANRKLRSVHKTDGRADSCPGAAVSEGASGGPRGPGLASPPGCAPKPPVRCDGGPRGRTWCRGCPRAGSGRCWPSSSRPVSSSLHRLLESPVLCPLPRALLRASRLVTAASGCTGRVRHLERSHPSPVLPLLSWEHRTLAVWGTGGLWGSGSAEPGPGGSPASRGGSWPLTLRSRPLSDGLVPANSELAPLVGRGAFTSCLAECVGKVLITRLD